MKDNLINIMIVCSPNYANKILFGSTSNNIVDQFIIFYYSIKKKWTFNYRINLVHSLPFNEEDLKKLKKLDIDLIFTEPTDPNPQRAYNCRDKCYIVEPKTNGTHRLVLDCDMLALNDPKFNLKTDVSAMFVGKNVYSLADYEYICDFMGYKKSKKFRETTK